MGKGKDAPRKPPARRRSAKKAAGPTGDDAGLRRALSEALEQQAATAEILRVIASSPGDSDRVLDTIARTATRLFKASGSTITRIDDGVFRSVAATGEPSKLMQTSFSGRPVGRDTPPGRAVLERRTIHIDDIREHFAEYPSAPSAQGATAVRTLLVTPLMRDGEAIGTISVRREEVRPFTAGEIALLESFADQAVIAIGNARLVNELRESLDRRTAIAEVLQVISSSPGELAPVFEAMLNSAVKLCEAASGSVFRVEGDLFVRLSSHGAVAESLSTGERRYSAAHPAGRMLASRQTTHVPDLWSELNNQSHPDPARADVLKAGVRGSLWVPMVKDDEVVAAFVLNREEVRPFTDAQIGLVESFADQAVIAIENARLLNELNAKNRDLSESLEQQTASAEILRAIASSPGDAKAVLETIVDTARRLFASWNTTITQIDGGIFRGVIAVGPNAETVTSGLEGRAIGSDTVAGRAIQEKSIVHVPDVGRTEFNLRTDGTPNPARTIACAPLLCEGEVIGTLGVVRSELRPFSDKELSLLGSFADQAVIAIENARLLGELRASLQQQTATADVLGIISRSAFDLQPVFEAVAESSVKLCDADKAFIFRYDGELLRMVAAFNSSPEFVEWVARNPIRPGRHSGAARAALERRTIHVHDVRADPEYSYGAKDVEEIRTILGVPILKGGDVLGVVMIYRLEVRPFTDKQIALVETFADQAGIAIENARLLTELRESLDRQTATADILRIVAATPGDATRALDTIAETAVRMFDAAGAIIRRLDEDRLTVIGLAGSVTPGVGAVYPDVPLDRSSLIGNAVLEGRMIHVVDPEHPESGDKAMWQATGPMAELSRRSGRRTTAAVPLLREGKAIGGMVVVRTDVRAFTDQELALLQSFADQAVIAIENARLLNELNTRNRDLAESLETQTASAEILRAIASAPEDDARVLDAIARNAQRLLSASGAAIARLDHDNVLRRIVTCGRATPISAYSGALQDLGTPSGRAVLEKRTVHVEDILQQFDEFPTAAGPRKESGVRTALATPLMREDKAIGAIAVLRHEVRPFTAKEIELLEGFADQAAIAIENARLLGELREALERRTATAEVLTVISSSPGDVQPVFETMLDHAVRLCEAGGGGVLRIEGRKFIRVAGRGKTAHLLIPGEIVYEPGSGPVRMLETKRTFHVPDFAAHIAEFSEIASARPAYESGVRSLLWVPMVKDGEVVAAFVLQRYEKRAFTDAQIALVENFADQAVIAIENARLLSELRSARDEAERALGELKAAQASLIQAEKMASLGQLTAGIAHEIKNPLNFVNNFAGLSVELLDELKETAAPVFSLAGAGELAEVNELVGMLTSNLEKIAEHGKRADGIVKSMLAHSRGGSGERQEANVNGLVEEALNLAYHGARAQDPDFNVTLERDLDPSIAPLELVPQELTRVFLNLFANGFYAADKRRRDGGDAAFGAVLTVATRDLGGAVEIRIRDNGVGISAEHRVRLFEPFFTTKPTGEGTGLGLSISYDIVTQQHGGTIAVESEPGAFTEFTVTLPRRTAPAAGADRSVAE